MPRSRIAKPKKNASTNRRVLPTKLTKSGLAAEKNDLRMMRPAAKRDRKRDALKRLQVTPEQLRAVPEISTLLKQARGGLTGALEAMRFSANGVVAAFLEKYDAVPARDRKSLPWEAIALAADVDLSALLGGAVLAIQSYSRNAVKIIALSHHPEVMRNRVKFAKLSGGERDRAAIDTGLGFLPTAKGSTFIINPGSSVRKDEDDEDDDGPADPPEDNLDHLFPSLSHTQEALVSSRARLLEAGS